MIFVNFKGFWFKNVTKFLIRWYVLKFGLWWVIEVSILGFVRVSNQLINKILLGKKIKGKDDYEILKEKEVDDGSSGWDSE